jgi:zinc/manganese transport system permease protein
MPGAALGFLYAGYSLAVLTLGGLLTGLAVAGLTALTARSRLQRQDSPLIVFYLVSLSFGVLVVAARGSQTDLMHVLFGTVLAVDVKALLLIAGVSSVTMLMVATFYRPLVVESFDRRSCARSEVAAEHFVPFSLRWWFSTSSRVSRLSEPCS